MIEDQGSKSHPVDGIPLDKRAPVQVPISIVSVVFRGMIIYNISQTKQYNSAAFKLPHLWQINKNCLVRHYPQSAMGALSLHVIVALAILGMSNGAHPEHKAPLMGLSSEDRIPQEHIVLLKADISPLSTSLDAFQGYITRRRLLGVEVMGQVQMREFVAILVSANDAGVEMLRSYQDVSMITTNTVIKINSQSTWTSEVDSGKCVQQEPGE